MMRICVVSHHFVISFPDLFAPLVDALGPNVPTQIVRYPLSDASDYATCKAIARDALPTDPPYVLLGESFCD